MSGWRTFKHVIGWTLLALLVLSWLLDLVRDAIHQFGWWALLAVPAELIALLAAVWVMLWLLD